MPLLAFEAAQLTYRIAVRSGRRGSLGADDWFRGLNSTCVTCHHSIAQQILKQSPRGEQVICKWNGLRRRFEKHDRNIVSIEIVRRGGLQVFEESLNQLTRIRSFEGPQNSGQAGCLKVIPVRIACLSQCVRVTQEKISGVKLDPVLAVARSFIDA